MSVPPFWAQHLPCQKQTYPSQYRCPHCYAATSAVVSWIYEVLILSDSLWGSLEPWDKDQELIYQPGAHVWGERFPWWLKPRHQLSPRCLKRRDSCSAAGSTMLNPWTFLTTWSFAWPSTRTCGVPHALVVMWCAVLYVLLKTKSQTLTAQRSTIKSYCWCVFVIWRLPSSSLVVVVGVTFSSILDTNQTNRQSNDRECMWPVFLFPVSCLVSWFSLGHDMKIETWKYIWVSVCLVCASEAIERHLSCSEVVKVVGLYLAKILLSHFSLTDSHPSLWGARHGSRGRVTRNLEYLALPSRTCSLSWTRFFVPLNFSWCFSNCDWHILIVKSPLDIDRCKESVLSGLLNGWLI